MKDLPAPETPVHRPSRPAPNYPRPHRDHRHLTLQLDLHSAQIHPSHNRPPLPHPPQLLCLGRHLALHRHSHIVVSQHPIHRRRVPRQLCRSPLPGHPLQLDPRVLRPTRPLAGQRKPRRRTQHHHQQPPRSPSPTPPRPVPKPRHAADPSRPPAARQNPRRCHRLPPSGHTHPVRITPQSTGGPGRSPTCDLRVRSAPLYASELPGQPPQCSPSNLPSTRRARPATVRPLIN